VRFGLVVPYAEARDFAEIAALGESSGWDGVFTWEALWGVHAWVTLGAASMTTSRVRLGTILTQAARWKPWDLASAVLTVDRLSGGRAVLSVGLGALHDGWPAAVAKQAARPALARTRRVTSGQRSWRPVLQDRGRLCPPTQSPWSPTRSWSSKTSGTYQPAARGDPQRRQPTRRAPAPTWEGS